MYTPSWNGVARESVSEWHLRQSSWETKGAPPSELRNWPETVKLWAVPVPASSAPIQAGSIAQVTVVPSLFWSVWFLVSELTWQDRQMPFSVWPGSYYLFW
mgnify:CR=1 FL=1